MVHPSLGTQRLANDKSMCQATQLFDRRSPNEALQCSLLLCSPKLMASLCVWGYI